MAVGAVQDTCVNPDVTGWTMFAGQPLITGASLSVIMPEATTVTTNAQVALFPEPSVKVYVTVVSPRLKLAPGLRVLMEVGTTPELSVADGTLHVATALLAP